MKHLFPHITAKQTFLTIILLIGSILTAGAQQFSVKGFRTLPNDVTAFITPVTDLNGDACALLKVQAPDDFAFSTPLGIVKRENKVGEIWLYLPKGSKQITLKSPTLGVLRDYRFPTVLDSHMSYELTINLPITERIDTVIVTQTLRDTITVASVKPKVPWRFAALATTALHTGGPSIGLMLAAVKRHGAFLHVSSNLKSNESAFEVDQDGMPIDQANGDIMPYYSGEQRHTSTTFTAGPIHRICRWLNIFYGAGYGKISTLWQLSPLEGSNWVENADKKYSGIAAETGLLFFYKNISASMSAITIKGKQWQACIGVGIKLGK